MRKSIFPALFLVVFTFANAPVVVQATTINLSFITNYAPPSPCTGNVLAGSLTVFERTPDGDVSIGADSRYPPSPCNASTGGALSFNVTAGTDIYLSFTGNILNPDAADVPVYAFDEGTAEGDRAVAAEPTSAPLILIGTVFADSVRFPDPGPPGLPLFAFSSPGVDVGNLGIVMTVVPLPAAVWLFGSGLLGLARRKR